METPSDLWRIARLAVPGDHLGAVTTRRDSEAPSATPSAQRERRTLFLTVTVEKVEFHEFSGHVRISGPIVEASFDEGHYHTLDLEVGADVALTKAQLTGSDRALLEEGTRAADEPQLLVACADWGECAVVRLRGRSLAVVDERTRGGTGKHERVKGGQREKDRTAYVAEIVDVLRPEIAPAAAVVLAGPGFLKEELAARLLEASPAVKPKLKVFSTSEAGLIGVHELLRSGHAAAALGQSVAAQEAQEVERLVRALGQEGLTALGPAEVMDAVLAGATETLLVLESRLREPASVEILDEARRQRSHVLIVRTEGEPGKRLAGIGGVAALLRYPWRPTGASSG